MESEVNRNIEEQLSAFLDGELSQGELQLLVRRLERNQNYRETLARYASIGGLLRNDSSMSLADQLRANVMAELEHDGSAAAEAPATPVKAALGGQRWFRPAMAAAVAAIAVAGLLSLNTPSPEQPVTAQQVAVVSAAPEVARQVATDAKTSATTLPAPRNFRRQPIDQERMLSYLVSHGEYARSFQGAMRDSRVFVQQASYEE